jgi:hypothetical protein
MEMMVFNGLYGNNDISKMIKDNLRIIVHVVVDWIGRNQCF